MVVTCFKVYHRNRPQLLLMPVRTAQTPHPNGSDGVRAYGSLRSK